MKPFPCDQCGACCRHVNLSEQTTALDRGDGTCKHLETVTNRCAIYQDRPDICRVDRQYQQHYASEYSWDTFIRQNMEACKELKDRLK